MSDQNRTKSPARKPVKRSIFAKPTWTRNNSAESAKTSQDPTAFFSRSSHSFKDIIAEQEARSKAKAQRQKATDDEPSATTTDQGRQRDRKKPRLSKENEDETEDHSNGRSEDIRTPEALHEPELEPGPSSSPAKNTSKYISSGKGKAPVIELDSDDDNSGPSSSVKINTEVLIEDDNEENDDAETRVLVEAVRERRQLREQRDISTSPAKPRSSHTSTPLSPSPADDPVVHILIDSPIPDTNPLIVKRKQSQNLKDVRLVWCKMQKFSDDMTASVFLTYRGRRIYDVTSLKSLKIVRDVFDDEIKVHLEAMTQATMSERKRQAEADAAKESQPANEDDSMPTLPAVNGAEIKLTLRAKGFEDFNLKVKPTTTFEKIANAYRMLHKISNDQQIHLLFDGDRLDPNEMMKDSEVSDLDVIEVHMK